MTSTGFHATDMWRDMIGILHEQVSLILRNSRTRSGTVGPCQKSRPMDRIGTVRPSLDRVRSATGQIFCRYIPDDFNLISRSP